MKKVYVCSPYRGNVKKNTELAKLACRAIVLSGDMPVCPHLYFTRFLDDRIAGEREIGTGAGIELLKACDELCVVGNKVTTGMARELVVAAALGKKITHMWNPIYPNYDVSVGVLKVIL